MVEILGKIKEYEKMGQKMIQQFLQNIYEGFLIPESVVTEENIKDISLVNLVNRAYREWEQSKALFEEVHDPGLVDHAIYAMQAAEQKYIYLLNLAKKENVINETFYYPKDEQLI